MIMIMNYDYDDIFRISYSYIVKTQSGCVLIRHVKRLSGRCNYESRSRHTSIFHMFHILIENNNTIFLIDIELLIELVFLL